MKQIYILLIALLMGLSAKAESSGTCGPNLKWHLNDDGVLTILGTGEMYDYKHIDDSPWYFSGVTRIIIDDGVTTIGQYAFVECSKLTSITIPNSVTTIGKYAFYSCSSLTSVTIPNSVTTIGELAFKDCDSLTSVTIGNRVTSIGNEAFSDCSSLTSVTIPNSVMSIGDGAFHSCTNLSTLIIEDRNTTLTLGSNKLLHLVTPSNPPLFEDCKLDSVYIGGKIVYNTSRNGGYSPFYRNASLRTVKISDAETTIYDNEFYGCTNLQNVSIGDNVTSIGKWAFSGCSSLKNFTFGSGLQSIGQEAFSDCINITQISSEAVVPPTCDINALDDINKWNCKLFVPKANINAYKQAPQWKEFFFIEGTTGITNTVYNKAGLADVYTIDGTKRLSKASTDEINALPKGVYIVNGKKIIIK